ncbi:aminotransferase class I/II-fold pyridoxal phosphate-dependent enzyme [Salibacterium salarium]|uniref:Aminotransferase class I/II-fold pyridoxal phosphate-dependent enzyme n=1 Tax=Salibacterium salarium TaxID=284579 RepID=A0A3R9PJ55_9BACI|nr:aminotransferase class I/II-fold pyridoxal phosphate-dependent enzyme [Salibacterium salarium]RSL31875.1 aminotransferase class I/II-fold pyridoxal phosphate-dependent enzyme [Salibacterium salarium]
MTGKEQSYINEAFDLNWIAPLGNNVDGFEKELAEYVGVNHAAAVSSGTAAIHLALRLLEVEQGDAVFCSSLTFVASANPILYEKATPVLIDSEPETWNMSPAALERALRDAKKENILPKAVIVVNLYGQSAKMKELADLCDAYDVALIEDAAESLGADYGERKSGSFGYFGVFSFNGNKIITTSGGGMLTSNDEAMIKKARFLSTQARDPALHYQHSEIGYNYRMSNIVAGIGRAQLEAIDLRVQQRRDVFARYQEAFQDIEGFSFMPELTGARSNRWLTALMVNPTKTWVERTTIIEALAEENIEARPVWKPLHLQPLFEGATYYPLQENHSFSDELFEYGLCLPSGSNMTIEDQERVIQAIRRLL